MISKKKILVMSLLLTLPSVPCLAANSNSPKADTSSTTWGKLTPAWDKVSSKLIDFVGEKKQKLIADLAFAAVTAEMCDGLTLDKDKFSGDFDSLNDAQYNKLTPADKAKYGPKLMTFYGVYVGMLTAEASLEKAHFCAYARDRKTKGEGRYWIISNSGRN
jgi:hypothetical protein